MIAVKVPRSSESVTPSRALTAPSPRPKTRTMSVSSTMPVDVVSECMTRRSRSGASESRGRWGEWGCGWLYRRPVVAACARCSACFCARPLLASPPDEEQHAERDADEQEAPEDRHAGADAAERQRDELDDAPAQRQQRDDEEDDQEDPADPQPDRRARRRRDEAHEAQRQQLAVGGRGLAELLGRHLEVARAALGERQRRLGHAAQLQPLLRARGGDRGTEVLARALGVHALGGARAEDRLGGRAELGLGLELLVASGPRAAASRRALTCSPSGSGAAWAACDRFYVRRRMPVGSSFGSSGLGSRPWRNSVQS